MREPSLRLGSGIGVGNVALLERRARKKVPLQILRHDPRSGFVEMLVIKERRRVFRDVSSDVITFQPVALADAQQGAIVHIHAAC